MGAEGAAVLAAAKMRCAGCGSKAGHLYNEYLSYNGLKYMNLRWSAVAPGP